MKHPGTGLCKGCKDRTVGDREHDCHTTCEKYIEWKKKDWAFKGIRYNEKHNEINSYISARRRDDNT